MADIRLGIVTDAKGAIKDIRELAGATDKLGGKSLSTGISFAKLTGSIIGAQAILRGVNLAFRGTVGTLLDSVKVSSAFNQAFTESTAIMGDLSQVMKSEMVAAAEDVARTTTFSLTEAAKSYFFLASAGLSASDSIKALPIVSKFAQAGTFDLARATDLLTDAQSALGLTIKGNTVKNMENMVRVSDVLVKANILSNATVEQFSESLTNKAGASLRQLGKDMEEGVAVLATFADQGIKGSEAGTALGIVLRDLSTKAFENAEAFRKNKVAVFDSEGEFRNIADVIADLEDRLRGLSDEETKATFKQLGFADKSVVFIQSLIGMSEQIRDYEEALRDAGGITDEVANKQLTSFSAQVKLLQNNWEIFQKRLGDFVTNSDAVRTSIVLIKEQLIELTDSLIENREKWVLLVGEGLNLVLGGIAAFLTGGGLLITGLGKIGQALVAVQGFVIGVAEKFVRLVELIGKVNPAFAVLGDIQRAWIETAKGTIESEKGIADGMVTLGESSLAGAAQIDILQEKIEFATKTQLANVEAEKKEAATLLEVRQALSGATLGTEELAGALTEANGKLTELTQEQKGSIAAFKSLREALTPPAESFEILQRASAIAGVEIRDTALAAEILRLAEEELGFETRNLTNEAMDLLRAQGLLPPALDNTGSAIGEVREETSRWALALEEINKQIESIVKGGLASLGAVFGDFLTGFASLGDIAQTGLNIGADLASNIVGGLASAIPIIGPFIGPFLGQLAGAFVSGLGSLIGGIFGGRTADTVKEEVSREMGVAISDGLAKAILDSGLKNFQFLNEIFAEGGLSTDRLAEEIGDIFSGISVGDIGTPEGLEAIEKAIPTLIANFGELGTAGQAEVLRIVDAATQMGIQFEGLDDLLAALGLSGVENISAIRGAFAEFGGTWAEFALAFPQFFEDAIGRSDELTAAFAEMGGSVDALGKHLASAATDAAQAWERLARIMARISAGKDLNPTQARFAGNVGLPVPSFAAGAFVPRPTLAIVGDAPFGEDVIPRRAPGVPGTPGGGGRPINVTMNTTVNATPGMSIPELITAFNNNTAGLTGAVIDKVKIMGELA